MRTGAAGSAQMWLPNMRLKLAGLPLKGIGCSLAGPPPRPGGVPCARAHVARSLSAIR